jgi:uncharacterized protein YnzC (UPF0291/DUF896 family)
LTFVSKYDIIIIENKKGEKIMAVSRKVERELLREDYLKQIIESFLNKDEQEMVRTFMESDDVSPSLAQARELRNISKAGELNDEKVMEILLREELTPVNVRLKSKVLKKFFPQNYTSSQIEEIIIELLTGWAENHPAAG